MIYLTRHQDIGALLRHLRHRAGLTLDQVGARSFVTRKAVSSRELHGVALPAQALVEHARALGWRVALIPAAPGLFNLVRLLPAHSHDLALIPWAVA